MKEINVLDIKNLPERPRWEPIVLAILALDYWKAPEWLWLTITALFIVFYASIFRRIYHENRVDLFPRKDRVNRRKPKGFLVANFLVLCLALIGCKSERSEPNGTLEVDIAIRPATEIQYVPGQAWIWSMDDQDLTIESLQDLMQGIARGLSGGEQLAAHSIELNDGRSSLDLPQGTYLVAVMLGANSEGRYSFTTVNVWSGALSNVTKVFRQEDPAEYETW